MRVIWTSVEQLPLVRDSIFCSESSSFSYSCVGKTVICRRDKLIKIDKIWCGWNANKASLPEWLYYFAKSHFFLCRPYRIIFMSYGSAGDWEREISRNDRWPIFVRISMVDDSGDDIADILWSVNMHILFKRSHLASHRIWNNMTNYIILQFQYFHANLYKIIT